MICPKCNSGFEPRPWQVTSRDHRCLPCKRAQQNAANLAKGDRLKLEGREAYSRRRSYYSKYWKDQRQNPIHLLKRSARRKVSTEIEAGRLIRQNCEVCGSTKTDAHHADYSKPLDVQWLCRRCHFRKEKTYAST